MQLKWIKPSMQPTFNCSMPKKIRLYTTIFLLSRRKWGQIILLKGVDVSWWHPWLAWRSLLLTYTFQLHCFCLRTVSWFPVALICKKLGNYFSKKRKLGVILNILYICIVLKSMLLIEVFNFKCKLPLQNKWEAPWAQVVVVFVAPLKVVPIFHCWKCF